MILFTDYDGVCHPAFRRSELPDEENRPFSYLPRLENVLRDYPEMKIVISSSWRQNQPWKNVIKPFAPDIAARIIGATPVLECKEPPYPRHPRYLEIMKQIDTQVADTNASFHLVIYEIREAPPRMEL